MFDVDARNISLVPKSLCFSNIGSLWKLLGTYTAIVFLILLGRAAFVFPLSAISNYFIKREDRSSSPSMISFKEQVSISLWMPLFLAWKFWKLDWWEIVQIIIWWAGLMRGAVSIALAFKQVSLSFWLELFTDESSTRRISFFYKYNSRGTVPIECRNDYLFWSSHIPGLQWIQPMQQWLPTPQLLYSSPQW